MIRDNISGDERRDNKEEMIIKKLRGGEGKERESYSFSHRQKM